VGRFLRWAGDPELTHQSVTATDNAALTAALSPSFAEDVRSALCGLFDRLVGAGFLAVNSFPRDRTGPRETDRGITTPLPPRSKPHARIQEMGTEPSEDTGSAAASNAKSIRSVNRDKPQN
jgi:hypothetical protein